MHLSLKRLVEREAPVIRAVVLPVWFAFWSISWLRFAFGSGSVLGIDTAVYRAGSLAWISGADPWQAHIQYSNGVLSYAGLPTTVILTAPLALLPQGLAVGLVLLASIAAALSIIRSIGLPWWWLAFPPLVAGVVSGNPQIIITALLLRDWRIGKSLAALLKGYPILPLIGEHDWQTLAISAAAVGISVAVLAPLWITYLSEWSWITSRLASEAGGGLSAYGTEEFPFALAAVGILALINHRAAGWLAPVALWPASEAHYATFAMPFLRRGLLAAVIALPIAGVPALAVMGYAASLLWKWAVRRKEEATLSSDSGPV